MEDKLHLEQVLCASTRTIVGAGMGAILLYGAFFVGEAEAYNPYATHAPLAERSVELFNRDNSQRALTAEEKQWIAEGARDEDDPATRVVNHFYDPINNEGLSGFSSSKRWAHNGGAQGLNRFGGRDMTWEAAIAAYESGDRELSYRILGHLLHLIQDATVPAHVRQDPHLHVEFGAIVLDGYGGKDPYEQLSEPLTAPSLSGLSIPNRANFNAYLDATAKYTNNGFLSMNSAGFYANPNIIKIENKFLYTEKGEDNYRLASIPYKIDSRFFKNPVELDAYSFSDPLVISDYWSRLSPVAIENGAGVIQLFRNTVKEPQLPETGLGTTISSLFESSKKITTGVVARAQSSWEVVKFGWNRHAVDVASISFALQTNNSPSVGVATYQAQRDEAARKTFLTQLQNASGAQSATQSRPEQRVVVIEETTTEAAELPAAESQQPDKGEPARVARVIDGDTIELADGRKVRYIGVDAPEAGSGEDEGGCFADEATRRNSQLVLDKDIRMTTGPDDTDAYGRLLRFVWVGDTFINQSLIETGHAYAYDFGNTHEYSEVFAERQNIARDNQLGLWGPLCQGEEELLPETIPTAIPARIVINEVRMQEYEFIELFNPTKGAVSLAGYHIAYYASTRSEWDEPSWRRLLPTDAILPAGGFYIIAFGPEKLQEGNEDWHPYQTERLAQTVGTVALWANDPLSEAGIRIDAFGWGSVKLSEGLPFRNLPATHGSVARPNDMGSVVDRDTNIHDFRLTYIPTPGKMNIILTPPTTSSGVETPPEEIPVEATQVGNVFITEIQIGGVTAQDEFIELFNANATEVSVTAWSLKKKTQAGNESNLISAQAFSGTIPAGKHFLIVPQTPMDGSSPYTGATLPDTTYSGASYSIAANNTVLVYEASGTLLDKVGYGSASDFEGTGAAQGPASGQSIARRISQEGAYQDTDDNSADFELSATPAPQNTQDSIVIPEEEPWLAPLSSTDIRYPAVDASENIYFAEGTGIASYSPEGTQRWLMTDVTAYEGAILSADGTKLYTTGCGDQPATPQCYFATINTATGSLSNVTQIETTAHNGGPSYPTLDEDGSVYVATTGYELGSLWKFNADGEISGSDAETPLWPLSWEGIDWAALGIITPRNYVERVQRVAISGETLLVAAQPLSNQHYLFAFNKDTGAFLWQADMEQDDITRTLGTIDADDTAFYTAYKTSSSTAGIAAYSTADGVLLWHEPYEDSITWVFSLTVDDVSEFAFSIPTPNYGKLYRSSLGAGITTKLFTDISGAEITTPLISDRDHLYIATEDGIARAFRISDSEMVWEYDTGYDLQHIVPAETFMYGITETGGLVTLEYWE
jgi:micrococcal nuclease